MAKREPGIYQRIIEQAFESCFDAKALRQGVREFEFNRSALERIVGAVADSQDRAKNTSDSIYYYRYRQSLPGSIVAQAPSGLEWIIRDLGKQGDITRYAFCLVPALTIEYDPGIVPAKMLDATPAMISRYADDDEQAILASVRYNRLLDAFLGMPCYSLQSHMRRQMHIGLDEAKAQVQVDVDEMYVAVDGRGVQYAVPVEAKVGTEHVGRVQIEKNLLLCKEKYPAMKCRPVAVATGPLPLSGRMSREIRRAAKSLRRRHIVIFEFDMPSGGDLVVIRQAQYHLVPSDYTAYDSLPVELRNQRLVLTDEEIEGNRG